jgi:hypothetical protein
MRSFLFQLYIGTATWHNYQQTLELQYFTFSSSSLHPRQNVPAKLLCCSSSAATLSCSCVSRIGACTLWGRRLDHKRRDLYFYTRTIRQILKTKSCFRLAKFFHNDMSIFKQWHVFDSQNSFIMYTILFFILFIVLS